MGNRSRYMNNKMMIKRLKLNLSLICACLVFLSGAQAKKKSNQEVIEVQKATDTIEIDGLPNEATWNRQPWHPIDQLWLGEPYSTEDFSGRYKLLWDESGVYLLAEITDDVLLDRYPDPLKNWWDDDCLEIFIDENNNGGDHQFNHTAFAYHVALDGNVVDMSTNKQGKLYNSHVRSARSTSGTQNIWELKILIFDETFSDDSPSEALTLKAGKTMGFALAYCDNDQSEHRENFVGSSQHEGFKQNQGWINASIFGTLVLKE
jgi:hypothetical protein